MRKTFENIYLSLTLVSLFVRNSQTSSEVITCVDGEVNEVEVTEEVQYLVSSNWVQSGDTIVADGDFQDGSLVRDYVAGRVAGKVLASNCSYEFVAPEGFHVWTELVMIGLSYSSRVGCVDYIWLKNTTFDGRFCSNQPWEANLNGTGHIVYEEDSYYFYQPGDDQSSMTIVATEAPSQCSTSARMQVEVLTSDRSQDDDKLIGFAVSFRLGFANKT